MAKKVIKEKAIEEALWRSAKSDIPEICSRPLYGAAQ